MEVILKKRLGETVAMELRSQMESGVLTGELPGVRLLAKALGVSVPTVRRALHQLEAEGLLEGGGTRRRWRVHKLPRKSRPVKGPVPFPAGVGAVEAPPRQNRLLFITSYPINSERGSGVQVFAELLNQMGSRNWEIMHRVENFEIAKKPRRSWNELMKLAAPDAVVVLGGTAVLGKWIKEKGIRALFLGGDPGNGGPPRIAVNITTMLGHAVDRLLATGHRSILLPLCGRGKGITDRCRETGNNSADAARVARECFVIAESSYSRPEVMVDLLRHQWQRRTPDALVFFDSREFLAAASFLHKIGIEIPRDLSVVVLSHNPMMDWHVPAISHFEHPAKLIARTVARWVTDGRLSGDPEPRTEISARWVEGKSIMERK